MLEGRACQRKVADVQRCVSYVIMRSDVKLYDDGVRIRWGVECSCQTFNFSPFSTLFLFFPLLFSYPLFLFHVIFSCSLFQHHFLCFSFLAFLLPLVHLSPFFHFFPFCTPCLIFPLFLVLTSLSYLLPFSFCSFACHLFCDKCRVWPWCRPGYQTLNQY